MRSCDELESIDVVEFGCHFVAKKPAGASWTDSPSLDFFGVRPNEIAEGTFVWNLLSASHNADLINGANLRTQTAMNAKYLAVDDSCQNQEVENVTAGFPHRGIPIFRLALFIKAVNLSDLSGLVIASNQNDAVGVPMRGLVTSLTDGDRVTKLTLPSST